MGESDGGDVCDVMAEHDVLFFGSVMVMLMGVRVKNPVLLQQTSRGSCVTFCVRAAVAPARGADVAERMCECVDSAEHPLRDATMAEELLVPVLFERAPSAHGQGRGNRAVGGDSDAVEARLVLEISVARGDLRSCVARHVVLIQSLIDIADKNCGVVVARVGAAALLRAKAWGQAAQSPTLGEGCSVPGPSDDNGCDSSGLELQFIVRALDMSEPVRITLAAEHEARTVLRVPSGNSKLTFALPAQRLPYGVLPLDALYYHYCRFFELFFGKTLSPSKYVVGLLNGVGMDGAGFRWSALTAVDMRPVLLGDKALAPFLATLYYCSSLVSLVLDQNGASDITCYRLAALFYRHRHLREVSCCRNEVHECGAEQLLRLARRNKGVTQLDVSGNACSSHVAERIKHVTGLNQQALSNDVYNVLSSVYDYAVSPTSISPLIVKKALVVWSMLTISPVRTADCTADDTVCSLIPQCALAPLLNEVMRTVALRMSQTLRNTLVLSVFSDIESHWKAAFSETNCGGEFALQEREWNCGKRDVDATELEDVRDMYQREKQVGTSFVDVEDLYSLSFIRTMVVTMRCFIAEAHWAETAAVLKEIGKRQRAVGVMPGDYRDALEEFVQSLTIVCGREQADAENSAALLQCLATGMRVVIAT